MSRLSLYLLRQYAGHGLSLFGAVVFLVWITQALRLFELVTAKGQDLLTLLGQSLLTTPPLAKAMLYICIGIGIARTLDAMQTSRELHTLHATRRTGALWSSLVLTTVIGSLLVGAVAHVVEPYARRAYSDWSERIAADLVGRTLEPNQFREIAPGFVVGIGGRLPDGTITDFFADDSRDADARRTYLARRATIVSDSEGLSLALQDGVLQYYRANSTFSEVGFSGYQLALGALTAEQTARAYYDETYTLEYHLAAMERPLNQLEQWTLQSRWMELPRVAAMCLLVAALSAFPTAGRGRFKLPVEIIIVGLAMIDRVMSDQVFLFNIKGLSGIVLLLSVALGVFAIRFSRPYWPRLKRVQA